MTTGKRPAPVGGWKKGESGNPGGRPKQDNEVKEMCKKLSPAAVNKLAYWMKSNNPKASVAACTIILDRAYGKATTILAGEGEKGLIEFTLNID